MWARIWTIWALNLGALIVFFAVFEGIALARKAIGDTLSEQVWRMRDNGSPMFWVIIDIITVAAITFAWLLFHFRFQKGRVA